MRANGVPWLVNVVATQWLSLAFCLALVIDVAEAVPITSGQGPAGFEAANGTSNLQLWLKSDSGVFQDTGGGTATTTTGQAVARWDDASGHPSRILTQGAAGAQPVFTQSLFNGLPGVGFKQDGTTDTLLGSFGTVPGAVARTVFIVAKPDEIVASKGILDLSAATVPPLGQGYAITPEVAVRVSGNQVYNGALVITEASLLSVRAPANSTVGPTGTTEAYINSFGLTTNPASVAATINSTNAVTELGRVQLNSALDYKGQLAEVVVYNRYLNDAEKILVENYLSARFNAGGTTMGVNRTLGANDFYAGDLSTNGNFDFDVVGVGNAGTGSVVNAGAAGFGIEVVAGAGAGQMDAGEYLLAGHDGTSNALVEFAPNNPNFVGQRWDREWYLDKTGTLDATIAFDFEDAGLATPLAGSTFQLLYSADGNFSDGWEILAETNSITSGTVAFSLANALLLDGYYTLGLNIDQVPEPSSLTLMLGALGCGMLRRRKTLAAAQLC